MNLLFLGERRISEECLKIICSKKFNNKFKLKGLVTNKDFYNGFINQFKDHKNVEFISNASRNEEKIIDFIKKHKINLLISTQHVWILSSEILDLVKGAAFNLHNSKLPNYKGYNSISHAILNSEKEYTSTIHLMEKEVDSGKIIVEKSTKISKHDTALKLYKKTLLTSAESFQTLLKILMQNNINEKKMPEGGTFYEKNDLESNKNLSEKLNTKEISKVSRAVFFPPYEPAYFIQDDKKYYIIPEEYYEQSIVNLSPYNKSDWE